MDKKGKSLGDSSTLSDLSLPNDCTLYFKDLGPQVAWTTVFLAEYAGPLFIYLLFYIRPSCIYGDVDPVTSQGSFSFNFAERLFASKIKRRN